MPNMKRGEIYYASLEPVIGSEQGGNRPVLVIQNDVGNRFSPTTIVAAITSRQDKTTLPTHEMCIRDRIRCALGAGGLYQNRNGMCERTV